MLIEAQNLSYGRVRGGRILAENVTFNLPSGGLLLVTGPNGSGKSTLLRVLQGQSPIFSGKLKVNVRRSEVGILPQMVNPGFHLPLTLGDVLQFSIHRRLGRGIDWDKVFSYGLIDSTHLGLSWNTASGGERKRTLLTRILLQEPELLLLDEPMNHLDTDSCMRVEKVIAQYLNSTPTRKRGVVLISHSGLKSEALLQTPTVNLQFKSGLLGETPDSETDLETESETVT